MPISWPSSPTEGQELVVGSRTLVRTGGVWRVRSGGDGEVVTRATFSDADYTVTTANLVAQTGTLTARRTVTLPAASAVSAGSTIAVVDESGTVTSANSIVVTRAGSDLINGQQTASITIPYGSVRLHSDGTSKWILATDLPAPTPGLKSGRYHGMLNGFGGQGGLPLTQSRLIAQPFWVPRATSFDRIGIRITGAASGSTIRYGIYADDESGWPGGLVVDFGAAPYSFTSDGNVVSSKDETISPAITLPAGLYWVAFAAQGGAPSAWHHVASIPAPVPVTTVAKVTGGTEGVPYQGSVTGALPSTFAGDGSTNQNPVAFWLRAV